MFQATRKPKTGLGVALAMSEVIYHCTVRNVRKAHNNALMAIGVNLLQAAIFVMAFYFLFLILGLRGAALRGDFLLYIMSGVFLYMTHSKALGAVVGAEGPASPMMQHAPMNTVVSICSAAISSLYVQVFTLFLVLFLYHAAWQPIQIVDPFGAFAMLLVAWFTGISIGLVLLALKPWQPTFVSVFSTIYQRANMIASGKMFVANALPSTMLMMFDWNPLFHAIDQARGFVFINYNPRYTSWEYAVWVGVVLLVVGMMGEFYTRRNASISWNARR